jgi:hypothetical protein
MSKLSQPYPYRNPVPEKASVTVWLIAYAPRPQGYFEVTGYDTEKHHCYGIRYLETVLTDTKISLSSARTSAV